MQQTSGRAAGTRTLTSQLVVLPNKVQPMPLLHSTYAKMVGEDDVMGCKQRECVAVEMLMIEDEVPLSVDSG